MEHAPEINSLLLTPAWSIGMAQQRAWEATGWIGGNINRLAAHRWRTQPRRTESSSLEALYGRSVSPWWDVLVARQDFRPSDSRTWRYRVSRVCAVQVRKLGHAVHGSGQVLAKAEVEYDVLLTNRLILQLPATVAPRMNRSTALVAD